MIDTKTARMGFIGAGNFITAHHLHTAGRSERMSVHAICDIDEARLARHDAEYHPEFVTADYRRILEDPDVDIVVVGTKQDLHARMIIEALDAGKWVFCEKPMAETAEDSDRVLDAEMRASGRLGIGLNRRFAPAYARLKKLLKTQKAPVYINYRLMFPNPIKQHGFYAGKERILYEGTHIFDLVCWLLESEPTSVYMTGDLYLHNICVLEFPGGSRVSFTCGSMGSYLLWKESIEVFSGTASVTVSDFVDMRVRGYPGEFDSVYPAHLGELAEEIRRHGFDYYEVCRGEDMKQIAEDPTMTYERVLRPGRDFGDNPFQKKTDYKSCLVPDKGWVQSLEHFADCFLNGRVPETADGKAGALSTNIALHAIESLKRRQPVAFPSL